MHLKRLSALIILASVVAMQASAAKKTVTTTPTGVEQKVLTTLKTYLPGTTAMGNIKVNSVRTNDDLKTIFVTANETAAYIPFTAESLASLKGDIRKVMGDKYADYEVVITSDIDQGHDKPAITRNFDDLVLFAPKKLTGPTETARFITSHDAAPAPKGLDGANIALWQSHGWYFEQKLNRWEWQRARIFQTVEDLYPQAYVMPYLMPMLQNAGAYVMSPRERDTNRNELIVDNNGGFAVGKYSESGSWSDAGTGFAYSVDTLKVGDNPFKAGTARKAEGNGAKAEWTANFPEAGKYAVYVSYTSLPNSAKDAVYTVNDRAGAHEFKVNQQMGGGTWIYLGHFDFDEGTPDKPVVVLTGTGEGVITADAVKIGGGMGNVARIVEDGDADIDYEYQLSQYPRYTEGARYFMQWAGAPDSVYTMRNNKNDYTDDYAGRGLWVRWLAGGSSQNPNEKGLGIPVDLSFAFHTDAGTTMNDSIIGTLGIYCTVGDTLQNGSSRLASRDLSDLIMTNIVNDIRATHEPNWTRRGLWDKSYAEARTPGVPSMLLELLSHQNFADMKYGLDPEFRFTVSRAIYKGMLEFIANRDGRPYVVTPLAPRAFAITHSGNNDYKLTWAEQVDSLEATAKPTHYYIEERVGDGAFHQVAKVNEPTWSVAVTDQAIHSYRVIAANDGGVSFPSEVLALCNKGGDIKVNIVNGFTRISGPDTFDSGEIAGFYDMRDHGVPDVQDINFIGSQFEFRREIPWMDDDAAGFGASRADYEDKVIAGNTHDFVYTHGVAIADAGYGFVSSSVEAYMAAPLVGEPRIVDLILGKQKEIKKGTGKYGTQFKAFPTALQSKIRQHTATGGDVFVSGAFVATDIWDNPYSDDAVAKADQAFATGVLGYHWRVGQASVTGQAYEVPSRFKQFYGGEFDFSNTLNAECYVVESPDSFYPADDKRGATIMRYDENNLIAGIAHDATGYRTVVIGFPFETIEGADARAYLMNQVLSFLSDRSVANKVKKNFQNENKNGKKVERKTRLNADGRRTLNGGKMSVDANAKPGKSASKAVKGKNDPNNPATQSMIK